MTGHLPYGFMISGLRAALSTEAQWKEKLVSFGLQKTKEVLSLPSPLALQEIYYLRDFFKSIQRFVNLKIKKKMHHQILKQIVSTKSDSFLWLSDSPCVVSKLVT